MTDHRPPALDDEGELTFPCRWPLKAMVRVGRDADELRGRLLDVLHQHDADPVRASLRERASRNGRYRSLTIEVRAQSRDHLERIYGVVRALDDVVMTL